MMQSELLQPSWSFNNFMDSSLDQVGLYGIDMDTYMGDCAFSSSSTSSRIFSSELVQIPFCDDVLQMEDFLFDMEGLEPILNTEVDGVYGLMEESEGSFSLSFPSQQQSTEDEWSPCPSTKSSDTSVDMTSIQAFPEAMEIDNQLTTLHLLKAYGEAVEKGHGELAEVIVNCVKEKVSPVGKYVERIAFNLLQNMENQSEYLREESFKNFEAAFNTFYQMFPYGRFAHFAANSAIVQAIPADAEIIHIIDFDMGGGIQWPPVIEAIGRQHKAIRLTSVKWREEDYSSRPTGWRFEETKRLLHDHARSIGLNLMVEETEIENLVNQSRKMDGRREWLAFNCMVGLPHMNRGRSRRSVLEFLRVAKESISGNRGIITYGDGDDMEKLKKCSGFGSFFNGCLVHYQTLFESMESSFPTHLAEARIAMECLFLAPHVSSEAWFQKWKQTREECDLQAVIGLKGSRLSIENLMEAKELVNEGKSSYGVRIEGEHENELVLEWRGTPLVKVSTWQ